MTKEWKITHDMFGHYRMRRAAVDWYDHDTVLDGGKPSLSGIMFRRHEIPEIIKELQDLYDDANEETI